jgi:hypothetical protein
MLFSRSRFEYGIYLLNKNLSQLRWQCSLATSDLRPILRNVAELMSLGQKMTSLSFADFEALPQLKTLSAPPKYHDHNIIIKSGRALIQGANRGMSPSKSVAAFPTTPNHTRDVSMTMSKSTNDLSLLHDTSREEDEDEDEEDSESVSSSSETESSNEGKQGLLTFQLKLKSRKENRKTYLPLRSLSYHRNVNQNKVTEIS